MTLTLLLRLWCLVCLQACLVAHQVQKHERKSWVRPKLVWSSTLQPARGGTSRHVEASSVSFALVLALLRNFPWGRQRRNACGNRDSCAAWGTGLEGRLAVRTPVTSRREAAERRLPCAVRAWPRSGDCCVHLRARDHEIGVCNSVAEIRRLLGAVACPRSQDWCVRLRLRG